MRVSRRRVCRSLRLAVLVAGVSTLMVFASAAPPRVESGSAPASGPASTPASPTTASGGVFGLADNGSTQLGPPGDWPDGAAYDNQTGDLYVTLLPSFVAVVGGSPLRVLQTFELGDSVDPVGIAVDPRTNVLFVATETDGVLVVSPETGEVLANISVGFPAGPVVFDPVDNQVWVAGEAQLSNGTLVPINATTYAVGVGFSDEASEGPSQLAYDPANGELVAWFVYANSICLLAGSWLAAFDPENGSERWMNGGPDCGTASNRVLPNGFAIDPLTGSIYAAGILPSVAVYELNASTGQSVYVTGFPAAAEGCADCEMLSLPESNELAILGDGSLELLNLSTLAWTSPGVSVGPYGLLGEEGPTGPTWAISAENVSLTELNPSASSVTARANIGGSPNNIALVLDGNIAYVAGSDNVSVVNLSTRQVVARIATGPYPNGIVYDPTTAEVFVATTGGNNLTIISTTNDSVVGSIPVCPNPNQLAWDNRSDTIVVACLDPYEIAGYVELISATSGAVSATIEFNDSAPDGVAYVPELNELIVSEGPGGGLAAISCATDRVVDQTTLPGLEVSGLLTYDPTTGNLLVAQSSFEYAGGPDLAIVDPTNLTELAVAAVPRSSFEAFPILAGLAAATSDDADNVTVLNGSTGAPVSVAPVPENAFPEGGGWDSNLGEAVVAATGLDALVYLTPREMYPVTVAETGLAPEVPWNVTLDGQVLETNGTEVHEWLPNGTYAYAVAAPSGYVVANSSGLVTIAGSGATISVEFAALHAVEFSASGLPSGTGWTVTLGGTIESDIVENGTGTIGFAEPSGVYAYSIGGLSGFSESEVPYSGFLTVADANLVERLVFQVVTYGVAFTESGLPVGTSWNVVVNAVEYSSNGSQIALEEPNGTYPCAFPIVAGYHLEAEPNGLPNLTVDGRTVSVATEWAPTTYPLEFVESGLPSGTPWTVVADGNPQRSLNATDRFSEPNGSVTFSLLPIAGFTANRTSGSVDVLAGPLTVSVAFVANATTAPARSGWTGAEITLAGVVVAATGAGIGAIAWRRRRSPSRPGPDPPESS